MNKPQELIADFARKLITDADALFATKVKRDTSSFTSDYFVDLEMFHQWCASCRLLLQQLGPYAEPWRAVLGSAKRTNNTGTVKIMLGAIKSLLENVDHGRLAAFEDIVFAEAFANLIDQGEYLLHKNYHLAAAVIFRAVLEERLRRMCQVYDVMPEKERPTIADYNQALYKEGAYDKIAMKQVEMMAAIGNAAAHGSEDFNAGSVKQLHSNLITFMSSSTPLAR